MYSGIEIKISKESSIIRCYKQYTRNSNILTKANVRYSKPKIFRILKIKHGVLQQNLSKCYHFESLVLLVFLAVF